MGRDQVSFLCGLLQGLVGVGSYGQGDIVEEDVESGCAADEILAYQSADALSLGDELTGVKLCDYALEDLVDNRRQDPFVVICAKRAVDLRQCVDTRPGEDTACDVDHLQVFRAGQGWDIARLGSDIVDDW